MKLDHLSEIIAGNDFKKSMKKILFLQQSNLDY